jgi:hypothetical protein
MLFNFRLIIVLLSLKLNKKLNPSKMIATIYIQKLVHTKTLSHKYNTI